MKTVKDLTVVLRVFRKDNDNDAAGTSDKPVALVFGAPVYFCFDHRGKSDFCNPRALFPHTRKPRGEEVIELRRPIEQQYAELGDEVGVEFALTFATEIPEGH